MSYARLRPELNLDWSHRELNLRDLEGNRLDYTPKSKWVEAVCFDGMGTGLYVLTDDGGDSYFTAHSIDLEFAEEKPSDYKEMTDGELLDCLYDLINSNEFLTSEELKIQQLLKMQQILKEAREN
jgi:hypothetical protein